MPRLKEQIEVKQTEIPINPEVPATESLLTEEKGEAIGGDKISLDYDHDPDAGTVSFTLSNGAEITVREPKAIDFLRVKGWRDSAPTDDQSPQMAGFKMVSLCTTSIKVPGQKVKSGCSVYELIDLLESQSDLLMAANCLDFFRDTIERFSG